MIEPVWPPEVEEVLAGRVKAVARAGAGTGKTTFATEKLLRAIEGRVLQADQAICITFTRKAAGELKERIRRRLMDHYYRGRAGDRFWRRQAWLAEQAPICTIHALAGRILRSYPLQAGLDLGFEILDPEHARALLLQATEEVLRARFLTDQDDLAALLSVRYRWDDSQHGKGLRSALQAAVEGWYGSGMDPATFRRTLTENWAEDPRAGQALGEVLLAALDRYIALKAGALDHHDLLAHACRLLRDCPAVRRDYQQRYRLVLVDEAQDNDPVQMELIGYLAEEPGDDRPWPECRLGDKLIVVGDLKQAIYRFRGADARQFNRVIGRILDQGGREISLRENRRCHPSIIRFVNALAPALFDPAVPPEPGSRAGRRTRRTAPEAPAVPRASIYEPARDDLIACRDLPDDGPRVWYLRRSDPDDRLGAEDRRAREADDLARLIAYLVGDSCRPSGRVYPRGAEPGAPAATAQFQDIAILFRKLSNLERYTAALQRSGIPFYFDSGSGERYTTRRPDRQASFYGSREVRDAIAMLRAIQNPHDRMAVAGVLRQPAIGITDDQWLHLGQASGFHLDRVIRAVEDGAATWPPRAIEAVRALGRLRQVKDRLAIARVLDWWWAITDAWAILAAGPDPRQAIANCFKLQDLARRAEGDGKGLREFLDHLEIEMADDLERPAAVVGARDQVVRLLTIHGSKGLEFPIVILPDCASQIDWIPDENLLFDREFGLVGKAWDPAKNALAATAALARRREAERRSCLADGRNLLYVAATRARDLLVFSGEHGTRKIPGCFRTWIESPAAWACLQEVDARDLPDPGRRAPACRWPESVPLRPPVQAPPEWADPGPSADPEEPLMAHLEATLDWVAGADAWVVGTDPSTSRSGLFPGPLRAARTVVRRLSVADLVDLWAGQQGLGSSDPDPVGPGSGWDAGLGGDATDAGHGPGFAAMLLDGIDWDRPIDRHRLEILARNLCPNPALDPAAGAIRHLADFLTGPEGRRLRQVPPSQRRTNLLLAGRLERPGACTVVEGRLDLAYRDPGGWRFLDGRGPVAGNPELDRFAALTLAWLLDAGGYRPVVAGWRRGPSGWIEHRFSRTDLAGCENQIGQLLAIRS